VIWCPTDPEWSAMGVADSCKGEVVSRAMYDAQFALRDRLGVEPPRVHFITCDESCEDVELLAAATGLLVPRKRRGERHWR